MEMVCAVFKLDSEVLNINLNIFGLQSEEAIKNCRPAGIRLWFGSGLPTTGL